MTADFPVLVPAPLERICKTTAEGAAWVRDLPGMFSAVARRWDFQPQAMMDAQYGVVVTGRCVTLSAILKLIPPGDEAIAQTAGLAAYGGRGAPRLLERDDEIAALLVERIEPGTDLHSSGLCDDAMTDVLGAVLQTLWKAPTAAMMPAHHLHDYLRTRPPIMAERWNSHPRVLPRRLLERAIDVFADWDGIGTEVVLHNDLHHGNVVRARAGWVAIDPSSSIGRPEADLAPMLRNPWKDLRDVAELRARNSRRLRRLEPVLGIDLAVARSYALANCVDLALWSASTGQHDDAAYFTDVATATDD